MQVLALFRSHTDFETVVETASVTSELPTGGASDDHWLPQRKQVLDWTSLQADIDLQTAPGAFLT